METNASLEPAHMSKCFDPRENAFSENRCPTCGATKEVISTFDLLGQFEMIEPEAARVASETVTEKPIENTETTTITSCKAPNSSFFLRKKRKKLLFRDSVRAIYR